MSRPTNANPPHGAKRARSAGRRRIEHDVLPLSIASGLAAALIALIWLSVVLLSGPGAGERVLLPIVLLVLPLLGAGAVAGWLVGQALHILMQRRRLDRG